MTVREDTRIQITETVTQSWFIIGSVVGMPCIRLDGLVPILTNGHRVLEEKGKS